MSKLKTPLVISTLFVSGFLLTSAYAEMPAAADIAASAASTANAIINKADPKVINRAAFTKEGTAILPVGYRNWVHVGTRINTAGTNILDQKQIPHPEILNAYVEPSAFRHFKATGQWADGSQIVKEFTVIRTGKDCDPVTFLCDSNIGSAIFEGNFTGLGMMIKDKQRFAKEMGNWGYFNFGHHAKPYNATSALQPLTQCADCHIAGAADQDYVFSSAHILLRNIKPATTKKISETTKVDRQILSSSDIKPLLKDQ